MPYYFNFLEDKVDPKQLLWNHYMNCCEVLGLKIDTTLEEYFDTMEDIKVKEYIDFLNLDLD